MGSTNGQRALALSREQQRVVSRQQLQTLGYTDRAIQHAMASGRLYPMWPGVYSVGTPHVSRLGILMGAVLACGRGAAVSHGTAAALLGICPRAPREVHVSVPAAKHPRGKGIVVHRRATFETTKHFGIPVTTPACTIVDIAPSLPPAELERAINQADVTAMITVPALMSALAELPRRPGLAKVRRTIDARVFRFTRSQLERAFIPIAVRAGLPLPLTRQWVNGYEVDFYWPELGLVVETDGGTYHRTPAQQTADRRRDQAHTASGLVNLRFTHGQIRYEPGHVEEILLATYTSSIVSASSPTSRNCV
jgi:very-short-patch-repair endonuclease